MTPTLAHAFAPAPATNPDATEADPAKEPVLAEEVVDHRDGAHLRPRGEDELLDEHPVDMGKATFEPGNGLALESKDGRFALATRLRAQFLYTLEHEDATDETSHGFQIRRARLQFKGHVFGEHNKFKTELALSPRDMGHDGDTTRRTPILDWYFDFDYLRDLTVRVGQYKVPFSRQRVVSSGDLELVDRSLANGEFNLDRDVGIDLRSKDFRGLGKLRYYAGVYLGEGRDPFQTSNFDMFYLGRVEVLPLGKFEDYEEGDFERTLRPRLSLGAAYGYVDGGIGNRGNRGSTPSDGGTTDTHNVTADLMFKIAGFSLFADVYYRQGHRNFGDATVIDDMGDEVLAPREMARDGLGWSATASYLVPRVPFQIAARYGQIGPLDSARSALGRRDEVGGGMSYYFAGHPLKLQLDVFGRFDDGNVRDAEEVVRLQLQAAF
ncbi:porin [Paraliomyxa miuraensis]|uniref:porin n=1 Tax=Paraliomyxa miuraensis TaxID=376150 RepID=UPI00224DCDA7|nr:porin [Paraliomyxa miuraensis]MCX4247809.1 OprO/OprP family phosphate-selective porin [Paraliomyxa miuraensis]